MVQIPLTPSMGGGRSTHSATPSNETAETILIIPSTWLRKRDKCQKSHSLDSIRVQTNMFKCHDLPKLETDAQLIRRHRLLLVGTVGWILTKEQWRHTCVYILMVQFGAARVTSRQRNKTDRLFYNFLPANITRWSMVIVVGVRVGRQCGTVVTR